MTEDTPGIAGLLGGRVYDLEQPRFQGAPAMPVHEPNFALALHRRHEPGTGEPRTGASGLLVMAEHSGTHIDALCHQAEDLRMHGDTAVDASVQTFRGFTALGVDTIAPIVVRGVLIDVAAHAGVDRLPDEHAVSAAELEAAATAQGVEVRPGDAVLVRTGNGALWESDPERYMRAPGMAGDASAALAARGAFVVGADNVAWDVPGGGVDPAVGSTLPGHVLLLVRAGIHIVENLALEELAAAAVREFVFVCLPLKVRGGTGSPVRPIAIAPAQSP
jgi:kynurenine formamidase